MAPLPAVRQPSFQLEALDRPLQILGQIQMGPVRLYPGKVCLSDHHLSFLFVYTSHSSPGCTRTLFRSQLRLRADTRTRSGPGFSGRVQEEPAAVDGATTHVFSMDKGSRGRRVSVRHVSRTFSGRLEVSRGHPRPSHGGEFSAECPFSRRPNRCMSPLATSQVRGGGLTSSFD